MSKGKAVSGGYWLAIGLTMKECSKDDVGFCLTMPRFCSLMKNCRALYSLKRNSARMLASTIRQAASKRATLEARSSPIWK